MESVPGAVATGYDFDKITMSEASYPVATAPGTDLTVK
jgi:hypothetical protein